MRISDWSSDVCSSDLSRIGEPACKDQVLLCGNRIRLSYFFSIRNLLGRWGRGAAIGVKCDRIYLISGFIHILAATGEQYRHCTKQQKNKEIGRASCRERVCQYV